MATATTSSTHVYTAAQNYADRSTLLATAIPYSSKLGTFGPFSNLSEARIKLTNVGILMSLDLKVTATIDNTGTTALVPGPLAPYNLAQKVSTINFAGKEISYATPHELIMIESIKNNRLWMGDGQSAIDTNQVVIPTAVGSGTLSFPLRVPVAYSPSDTRGAINLYLAQGDFYLGMNFTGTAVGDDSNLYTSGTATISNIYVEVWQNYLSPQVLVSGTAYPVLPLMDMATGYAITGNNVTSDNLAVGAGKFLNYPNTRQVLSLQFEYLNNGILTANGTDIETIKQKVSSDTVTKNWTPRYVRQRMREIIGGDMPSGRFYIGSRNNPVDVSSQSIVQLEITPSAVNGSSSNTYIKYCFESFYQNGQTLSAIAGA